MAFLLRVIGAVWILLTANEMIGIVRAVLQRGIKIDLGLPEILSIMMFAGGIGLLLLKEWGRWILLLGSIAFLLLLAGPSLLKLQIGPVVLRHLVFYGIFIALLVLPQSRSVTRG